MDMVILGQLTEKQQHDLAQALINECIDIGFNPEDIECLIIDNQEENEISSKLLVIILHYFKKTLKMQQ